MRLKLLSIPDAFHSDATKQKFNFCIDCGKYLLGSETLYVIEKAIRNFKKFNTNDTIFEYAMCMECQKKLWNTFSKSSIGKIEKYFETNIDFRERTRSFSGIENENINLMISNCVVKGTPIKQTNEYQLVAFCKGKRLIVDYVPFMISDEAMGEVAELLSNKTLDTLDGFIDDFLGLPPSLDIKTKPKVLFI